jgi:hypothetical protein
MTSGELAKTLWDLANAITGFAAVQGLIFSYACAKKETGDVLNRRRLKFAIAVMVAVIAAAQCAAVAWCRINLCRLDPEHCALHSEASAGRIFCIASIGVFSIIILYARQLFSKQPFDG